MHAQTIVAVFPFPEKEFLQSWRYHMDVKTSNVVLLYFPYNTMRILKDTDYTPRLFTVKNALQRIDAFVFLTINNIHWNEMADFVYWSRIT